MNNILSHYPNHVELDKFVYIIKCPVSFEYLYIGRASSGLFRLCEHLASIARDSQRKRTPQFLIDLIQYYMSCGYDLVDFARDCITAVPCQTEEELMLLEVELIQELNPLCNGTDASVGGI